MEPIAFSLCPDCENCPEVVIDAEGVRIGEEGNLVWLRPAEWNELVALVQNGKLPMFTYRTSCPTGLDDHWSARAENRRSDNRHEEHAAGRISKTP